MFKLFGKKGQSSSVFNLLIAALVSLAILGLLLSIMGGIGGIGGNKPDETAAKLIKNADSSKYSIQSDKATFDKTSDKKTISALSISEKSTVGKEQIVIKACGTAEQQFNPSNGSIINYTGTSKKDYLIYSICGSQAMTPEEAGVPVSCGQLDLVNEEYTCYVLVTTVN